MIRAIVLGAAAIIALIVLLQISGRISYYYTFSSMTSWVPSDMRAQAIPLARGGLFQTQIIQASGNDVTDSIEVNATASNRLPNGTCASAPSDYSATLSAAGFEPGASLVAMGGGAKHCMVGWAWTILPKRAGRHVILIQLMLRGPKGATQSMIAHLRTTIHAPANFDTFQPYLLSAATIIAAILSGLLSNRITRRRGAGDAPAMRLVTEL
jgi:hypothetical protein